MRRRFIDRGADPGKVTVVMDGGRSCLRSGERAGEAGRRPEVPAGSHGTIEPQYGLDTAIEAESRLVRGIPELELYIVGEGSQRAELVAAPTDSGSGGTSASAGDSSRSTSWCARWAGRMSA